VDECGLASGDTVIAVLIIIIAFGNQKRICLDGGSGVCSQPGWSRPVMIKLAGSAGGIAGALTDFITAASRYRVKIWHMCYRISLGGCPVIQGNG
jgi:hypothetical protein